MERPGVSSCPFLERRRKIHLGNLGEEAHGQDTAHENIVDQSLRLWVREFPSPQAVDFPGQATEVVLEAEDRVGQFDT